MNTAARLLNELHRRGVVVRKEGDSLVVRPKASVTPELRSLLLAHKPEILAMLSSDPSLGSPLAGVPDISGVAIAALTSGACYACGGVVFWKLRDADELVCAICHPPGPPPDRIEWRRGRARG